MSVGLQAKLLRVLQEGEIDRIGGKDAIQINTRVIATTNRDPISLVANGEFREDLFYRLNVIRIDCVPLRGRKEAILNLAETFLTQSALNQGREGMRLSSKCHRQAHRTRVAWKYPRATECHRKGRAAF